MIAAIALRNESFTGVEIYRQGIEALSRYEYSTAIDLFTKALDRMTTLDRDTVGYVVYYLRASAHRSLGQYDCALEDAEASIRLNKNFAKSYCEKGAALQGLRLYDSSVEAYNRAELIF